MCYGSQLWRTVVDGEGIVSTGPVVVRLAERAHEREREGRELERVV